MRQYSFNLSPAYVARRAKGAASDQNGTGASRISALTIFSAVMLASIVFALVWGG